MSHSGLTFFFQFLKLRAHKAFGKGKHNLNGLSDIQVD